MRAAKFDVTFKVILCGDQGVGKKTLLTRLIKGNYKLTPANIDFLIKTIDIQAAGFAYRGSRSLFFGASNL